MPDEAEMVRAYQTEYVAYKQTEECSDPEKWRNVSRTYRASIIQVLADYRVNGMVVDYGAGWGYLVNAMIQQGFDARGVKISQDQVAYAQQRGLPIQ